MFRAVVLILLVPVPVAALANDPPDLSVSFPDVASLSQRELFSGVAVIAFGIFVLLAAMVLKRFGGFSEDATIRLLSLILIVSGTLFLVTLGYSAEQIAPALGILGTIAGYILGRSARVEDAKAGPG